MKPTSTPDRPVNSMRIRFNVRNHALLRQVSGAVFFTLLGLFTFAPGSLQAQTRQIWAQYVRMTVPSGQSGTATNQIFVVTTNTVTPVTLSIGALPLGVTSATFTPANPSITGEAVGWATLTVTYNGNVPQGGANEIEIIASGDLNYRLPIPIHSAKIWTGSTNSPQWSSSANWSGGTLPTPNDVVLFPSSGANDQGTNTFTNVIVTTSQEVAGIRFNHGDKDNDQTYRFDVKPGATLSVTGTNGFRLLQDTVNLVGQMDVRYLGGGALVVSNSAADIAMLKEAGQSSTLDLGGLGNFVADVRRIGLGDYRAYPYYTTNGYSARGGTTTNSRPARFFPQVMLARTNFIRAQFVDPSNYNNPTNRDYALTISKSESQGLGSGSQFSFLFGQTNVFFMDSIVFGGSVAKGDADTQIRFNTDTNVIPTNVVPVVVFRGFDGVGRMSVFSVADNSAPGGSGSGSKATVNLNGGRVDALVDRLYLGRDRLESKDNDTAQAALSISAGVFDVNTAFVSAQEQGNNLIDEEDQGDDPSGEVYGTLNVSTSAVFRVNGTLHLGYTTADAGDKRVAEEGNGQLNISNGGIVMASNIWVGGVTKVSVNNRISITGGSQLIVTNEIGQPDKALNALTMSDSTLTLHVDGSKATPYVYVNSLVTSGSGNVIKLASVSNLGAFPAQLPIISYQSASPNFSVELPAGLFGYVVNDTANHTVDVVILNVAPATLVWNGTPGTAWDTSSPNWQAGLVFEDGDAARFDEMASNPTVTVPGTVYVGGTGVLITNQSVAYSFSGAGTIGGTAPMNKWGTNVVTLNVASELPLTIHQGIVEGAGSIGATTVAAGSKLNFAGSINRLTSSGDTMLLPGATVANTVTVEAGTLTNSGTINNNVLVRSNAIMHIPANGKVSMNVPSTSQIDQGGLLVLDGTWQNGLVNGPDGTYRIDLFGTLVGTGQIKAGKQDLSAAEPALKARLNIGSGGVLSPGDAPGQIATFKSQGRFDFVQGSRIIMDVDMDSADGSNPFAGSNGAGAAKNSDVVYVDRWSTMQGVIQINNIGTQPFRPGTVLKLFKRDFDNFAGFGNIPLNTDQVPVVEPHSPGLGLVWDLSQFRTNGIISILGTATNSVPLQTTIFQGTNITFSWPSDHKGWELQSQVNPLNVGLSTNWTVVAGSTLTNQITITNWIDTNKLEIKVFRLAHPTF